MIRAVVVGDDRVQAMLKEVHPQAMKRLGTSMRRVSLELLRYVKAGKLSGQVLKNRTGTLRRRVNQEVEITDTAVTGSVGTNLAYGKVHEYGGTVTIKEHLRKIKQAFGRPLKEAKTITVRAHSATYPERSYLRSALKDMEATIKAELAQAVHGLPGKW